MPEEKKQLFTKEEVTNIGKVLTLLKEIRARLIREGVDIEKVTKEIDMIVPPNSGE